MSPGKDVARKIARSWLREQSDLPKQCDLEMHDYDEHIGGRLFSANRFVRPLKQQCRLVEFYVLDDGAVKIRKDRRRSIAIKAGKATESRFFEAMQLRTQKTPPWFRGIKRSPRSFDRKGIDAFAFVGFKKGERRLRIPIQIKSGRKGAEEYRKKHPLCNEHGVPIVIINPSKSDEQLRQHVYSELGAVRRQRMKTGIRFSELLTLLDTE